MIINYNLLIRSSEVHERNDETSNPNEKKLCKNVPSKNKQFKQNNQEDKTEVKVLVTEGYDLIINKLII